MKRTMNEIFSENLRNQLYLNRWSQADLARKMDTSEASVSKWCLGTAVPRPKKIDQMCQLFGCTVEDMTTDHTKVVALAPEDVMAEEMRNNPKLFTLMYYASKLSEAELDKLIEQVRK